MFQFGTTENPTQEQKHLTEEVQKRYKAFAEGGDPNADGLESWAASDADNIQALNLGGDDSIDAGGCIPGFWGAAVQYDYQVYGA